MNFAAWFSSFFLFLGVLTNRILAQDFKFRPERQQIPTPGCLVMKGAWKAALRPAHRTSTMRGWPISGIGEVAGPSDDIDALEIVTRPKKNPKRGPPGEQFWPDSFRKTPR